MRKILEIETDIVDKDLLDEIKYEKDNFEFHPLQNFFYEIKQIENKLFIEFSLNESKLFPYDITGEKMVNVIQMINSLLKKIKSEVQINEWEEEENVFQININQIKNIVFLEKILDELNYKKTNFIS